ncbi:protein-arginine deiminase type-3-like [Liasis olivaceus]
MPEQRWVRLSTEKATSALHILGTELCLDICRAAPSAATTFDIWTTVGLNFYVDRNTEESNLFYASRWQLDKTIKVTVTMDAPSIEVDEEKIRISYYKENSKIPIAKAILHITCVGKSCPRSNWNQAGEKKPKRLKYTFLAGGSQTGTQTESPNGNNENYSLFYLFILPPPLCSCAAEISLDADINRSGMVTRRGKQKSQWT